MSRLAALVLAAYSKQLYATCKITCQTLSLTCDSKVKPRFLALVAGVTVSLSMVCIYYALDRGKVSVVIPVSSTGPFFSLIFSALVLREVERVTLRIVLSAAMIFGCVLLITLWK